VENAQDNEARAIEAILEYIRRVENLQHELAIFFAASDWTPESGEYR
jgi:hypothetical protein